MEQEENLERLVDSLIELGFPKTNMREYIEGCAGLEEIPYFHRRRIGDDEMTYQLTIKKDSSTGLYHLQGYEAALLQTHPVPHGKFGDIDTMELERQMKETDWSGYGHEVHGEKSGTLIKQVLELSAGNDPRAVDVANRLQLRYWMHTPVAQHLNIFKHITDYQKRFYFPLNNGFGNISAREAYNLLSGRSVLKFYQKEGQPRHLYAHWRSLNDGKLVTLPDYDMVALLQQAGVRESQDDQKGPLLIYDLIRGERPLVHLAGNGKETEAYIEADPRLQSLRVYDKDLNRLHIAGIKQDAFQKPKHVKQAKRNNKNKGRSL